MRLRTVKWAVRESQSAEVACVRWPGALEGLGAHPRLLHVRGPASGFSAQAPPPPHWCKRGIGSRALSLTPSHLPFAGCLSNPRCAQGFLCSWRAEHPECAQPPSTVWSQENASLCRLRGSSVHLFQLRPPARTPPWDGPPGAGALGELACVIPPEPPHLQHKGVERPSLPAGSLPSPVDAWPRAAILSSFLARSQVGQGTRWEGPPSFASGHQDAQASQVAVGTVFQVLRESLVTSFLPLLLAGAVDAAAGCWALSLASSCCPRAAHLTPRPTVSPLEGGDGKEGGGGGSAPLLGWLRRSRELARTKPGRRAGPEQLGAVATLSAAASSALEVPPPRTHRGPTVCRPLRWPLDARSFNLILRAASCGRCCSVSRGQDKEVDTPGGSVPVCVWGAHSVERCGGESSPSLWQGSLRFPTKPAALPVRLRQHLWTAPHDAGPAPAPGAGGAARLGGALRTCISD